MINIDRDVAAKKLAQIFYEVGVQQNVKAFFDGLNYPGGQDKETWEAVREWYNNQSNENKQLVKFIVEEASILAAFGLLVHLDGNADDASVDDRYAELAVSLNVYDNANRKKTLLPDQSIEICPVPGEEDVHDIFLNLIDEIRATET